MNIRIDGMEQLAELIDMINPSPAEIRATLESGVNTFIPLQRQIAGIYDHRLTGKMIQSIDVKYESEKAAQIYPMGSDSSKEGRHSNKNPVRNATKAFIANYGRTRQAATHWVEHSTERGEQPVADAMQTKFNEILKAKGLI